MKKYILLATLFITGCTTANLAYQDVLTREGVETPYNYNDFMHCHGYGCKFQKHISLSSTDWADITKPFSPSPRNAEEERAAIAQTIGRFESVVGAIAGTDGDIYGTFKRLGDYQLDCTDESLNTTVYLALLQRQGFLKFHDLAAPETRVPFVHSGIWPHKSAVIKEKETGMDYVVDSWFHDNGYPAEIVTLSEWKAGWKPAIQHSSRL